MEQQRQQTLVVLTVLVMLVLLMGAAYWAGEGSRGDSVSAVPVKKFRAKPGTERENARALTSSVPSAPEEATNKPIEIWGSLDGEEGRGEASLSADYTETVAGEDLTVDQIRVRLAELPDGASNGRRAELEAALGFQLAELEGVTEESEAAFSRAYALAATPADRLAVMRLQAKAVLISGEFERVTELTEPANFINAPFNADRVEIEVVRGLAYEGLGMDEQAENVYSRVVEAAFDDPILVRDTSARSAVRQAAVHLARLFRERGETTKATGLSRRLRAWLHEEQLVLR